MLIEVPVLFLIDSSGSMDENMDVLNAAMRELIDRLKKEELEDFKFKIGVICFGDDAKIHIPVSLLNKLKYEPLVAKGKTNFLAALKLGRKVIKEEMKKPTILILLSDGYPDRDWKDEFKFFLADKKIKESQRMALGIGPGYEKSMLKKFVSNSNYIFEAIDSREIYDFFKIIPEYINI